MYIFVTITFILLFLTLVGFIWWHLFFRITFIPPNDSTDLWVKTIQKIPFIVENNLPFPAGLRSTNRQMVSLNGVWDFCLENKTNSTQLSVPACFNTADSPLRDYQGAVWYERNLTLSEWPEDSLLRITLLGSFYYTEVWLDDNFLGDHEGGYLPFYFDITNFVQPDYIHKIKIRVDNRISVDSLPSYLFQGHNLGWHPYGGLHRDVFIEVCPPTYCFKLHVDANIDSNEGLVHSSVLFHCPKNTFPLQNVTLSLLTNTGQILAESNSAIHWDGKYGIANRTFNISNPQLWEPGSPHQYRLAIQTEFEYCETTFGFRTIKATGGKLLLNSNLLILKGVCRHQEDRADGLAQKRDSVRTELETIQNLNGNFVRLAHYPHSSETIEYCDQLGLVTWVEIPLYQAGLGIIRFLFDKTKRDTGKTLRCLPGIIWKTNTLVKQDLLIKARNELLKMIERDRNHPSILFWGLGNECWTLNPAGAKALAWLREQAEAFDSKRLFSYAAFGLPVLGPLYERSFDVSDVVSVNEYFGWYYGKAQDAGPYLQSLARKYPHKPLLVTETGSDTVRGEHTSEVPPSRGYSEEYQVWYLEEQWRQMSSVPTFAGLSIWVLKDFLCPEYREDHPTPFYNLKGLLDHDGQPKAALEKVKILYSNN